MNRVTPHGFEWGPFVVERWGHVEGRGWVLGIRVGDVEVEIRASERGRGVHVIERRVGKAKSDA